MHNYHERVEALTEQLSELKKALSGEPVEFSVSDIPAEPYDFSDAYVLMDDIIIALVSLQKSVMLRHVHALEDHVAFLQPAEKSSSRTNEQQQDLFPELH